MIASEIAGEGEAGRRAEVLALLDAIADPCSTSLGAPIGLVGLGIVDRVDVDAAVVTVAIMPTIPGCLFIGVIEERIEQALAGTGWCETVRLRWVDGLAALTVFSTVRMNDYAQKLSSP